MWGSHSYSRVHGLSRRTAQKPFSASVLLDFNVYLHSYSRNSKTFVKLIVNGMLEFVISLITHAQV